jgi:mono/diheme cytochrome c family protein
MDGTLKDGMDDEAASVTIYLDDAKEPLAVFRPPAQASVDTTALPDGDHVLHLHAVDATGVIGVRHIPFVVRNGPYISVSGIKPGETASGRLDLRVNAFSSGEHFDPVAAESRRPAPTITWVGLSIFLAWSLWYGLGSFFTAPAFAGSHSGALGAANAPMSATGPVNGAGTGGAKIAGAFNYAATGPTLYATNCAACHGAEGAGVPGAFPALVADETVNAADASAQIKIVLHGLHGKVIGGKSYASQMPAFPQLSDADIAAIIDHERTSWKNTGRTITPAQVKQLR